MSTVGDNIRTMREQLGWTQEELAHRMGYKSRSAINKIELGINDIPQSKILKFAEVLGTSPAVLMGWVTEATGRKNDQLAQLIVRLRRDPAFFSIVEDLDRLAPEQLENLSGLVAGLLK